MQNNKLHSCFCSLSSLLTLKSLELKSFTHSPVALNEMLITHLFGSSIYHMYVLMWKLLLCNIYFDLLFADSWRNQSDDPSKDPCNGDTELPHQTLRRNLLILSSGQQIHASVKWNLYFYSCLILSQREVNAAVLYLFKNDGSWWNECFFIVTWSSDFHDDHDTWNMIMAVVTGKWTLSCSNVQLCSAL